MPLDPHLLKQFPLIEKFGSFEEVFGSPGGDAAFFRFLEDPEPWNLPEGLSITEESVPGPHGPVRVRMYRPAARSTVPAPGLVWMHGGAFVGGDIDMNESHMVCAELAARTGAVCVTVEYRLAVGGVHYPVPLDDVVAAFRWFVAAAEEQGVDAARVSIGGASAGGNLATAAAMRLRDEGGPLPTSMLLAYPLVHFPVPALEQQTLAEMTVLPPMLNMGPSFHESAISGYLGRITAVPAGVAPGNFALEGMPPAFLAPDEYDELRPSAELFARQLAASGVSVDVELAEGMIHGHLNRTPSLPAVEKTLRFFAAALAG